MGLGNVSKVAKGCAKLCWSRVQYEVVQWFGVSHVECVTTKEGLESGCSSMLIGYMRAEHPLSNGQHQIGAAFEGLNAVRLDQ